MANLLGKVANKSVEPFLCGTLLTKKGQFRTFALFVEIQKWVKMTLFNNHVTITAKESQCFETP